MERAPRVARRVPPAASTAQAVPVDTVAPSGELLCDAKDQALIYEETSLHLRMGDAQAV